MKEEGTVKGRCTFGRSLAEALGLSLKGVWHVAEMDGAVSVSGPSDGLDVGVDIHVCKLIMGSLEDDDLRAVQDEADRLLAGGEPTP